MNNSKACILRLYATIVNHRLSLFLCAKHFKSLCSNAEVNLLIMLLQFCYKAREAVKLPSHATTMDIARVQSVSLEIDVRQVSENTTHK